MKRLAGYILAVALLICFSTPAAYSAVTPGTKCSKVGVKQTYKGKVFTCIKLGSKLYWDNGKKVVSSTGKLVISFKKEWSYCVPTFSPSSVECSIWGLWSYDGRVPYDVIGYFYALADGNVYRAMEPQNVDELSYVSKTFSPGARVHGGASFEFPEGAYIEKIFIGNSYNWRSASVVFDVNAYARSTGID
jgi:hypothetical protein